MKKGVMMLLAFGTMCFSIGAASGVKITAALKEQQINYQGTDYNKQVIEYKGSNYVPLRAFSEMLGVSADYKNGIIYLGESGTVQTSVQSKSVENTKSSSSTVYGKANPVPVGITEKVQVTDDGITFTADMCIKEILRGESAWKQIQAANVFNEQAAAGKEYILAKISIKADSMPSGSSVNIAGVDFYPYSSSGEEYAQSSVVAPVPMFAGTLSAGTSLEGWQVFEVNQSDKAPKVMYGADSDGTEGAWFSLK